MQPLPPPPPPRPDMSWRADDHVPAPMPARPQLVTAAGTILIVLGVLQALAGLVFVLSPDDLGGMDSIGNVDFERVARGIGLFSLVVGALEILAGVLVLRLSGGGRILALVLASIGLLGGVASVSGGSALAVITLGLYAFVIYVLFVQGAAFRGAGRR